MSDETTWTEYDIRVACDRADIAGMSRVKLLCALEAIAAKREPAKSCPRCPKCDTTFKAPLWSPDATLKCGKCGEWFPATQEASPAPEPPPADLAERAARLEHVGHGRFDPKTHMGPSLVQEIAAVLNRRSRENVSNTADFLLAELMVDALNSYERTVERRETPAECVKRLDIDVPKWAAEIRAKIAESIASETPAPEPAPPVEREREPDWSKFVPTFKGGPDTALPITPTTGELRASRWTPKCGVVFRVGAESVNGSGEYAWNVLWRDGDWDDERYFDIGSSCARESIVIRHADGRWADGFNPEGPCKKGCGTEVDGKTTTCTRYCYDRLIADRAKAKAGEQAPIFNEEDDARLNDLVAEQEGAL